MATKWINLKCRVKWLQIYEPEEYSGDTRWIGTFYPVDGNEWEKFNKSGLQQIPKEDAEGNKFVRFRRPIKKLFPSDDEATYFTPPKITGAVNVSYVNAANGEELRNYKKSDKIEIRTLGDKVNIGNDSVVIVNLAVFDSGKGKGHRMESLNVLDLVEYVPSTKSEVGEEENETATEAVVKEETVEKKSKSKGESTLKEDMNDQLPW